jgi:putative endonuclease
MNFSGQTARDEICIGTGMRFSASGLHYRVMQALYFAGDWLRQRARERLVTEGKLAPHRASGARGEDLAHRYLQQRGLRIIGRNWRTRSGSAEIDIIAWDERGDDGILVFVEVKTRGSEDYNAPERQIDTLKRRNMARGAAEFVRIRFDVVSVVLGGTGNAAQIRHWPDAFFVDGLEARKAEPAAPGTFAAGS